MKTKLFFLSLATLLAFSCAKEETKDPGEGGGNGFVRVEINAGTEGVKTTLGEAVNDVRSIDWEKDDAIRIIYGNGGSDFVIARASKSGATTSFVAEVPETATTLYAVYPADAFESNENGTLTVNVPNWQDGNFASANIAVAKTTLTDLNFQFKNVCGYVLMELSNENIRKVTLEAEGQVLAGKVPVSFDSNGNLTYGEVIDGSSEVSAYFANAGQCVISVLPNLSFASGVGVTFADSNAEFISSTTLKQGYTLTRGGILNTKNIDDAISINYYATVAGAGKKDGSSWANAWDKAGLETFLETENPDFSDKAPDVTINLAIAGGTYTFDSQLLIKTKGRAMRITGGYNAENPAGSIIDPVGNATIITCTNAVTATMVGIQGTDRYDIYGLTFSGHKGNGTGRVALYIYNNGACDGTYLSNCYFKNNTNSGVGAALVSTSAGYVSIKDCTFEGNQGGGAVAMNIETDETAHHVISNCTFKNNVCTKYSTSQDSGAIKIGKGKVTVNDCTFSGNSIAADANGCGAAVWVATASTDSVRFNNCTFNQNVTKNVEGKGGAVYINRGTATEFANCTFTANECKDTSVTSYGGAVMIGNGNKHGDYDITVKFKSCTFNGNGANRPTAKGDKIGAGAIFMKQGEATTTNCILEQCTITNQVLDGMFGAAIYGESGNLTITDGEISKNDARATTEHGSASYGVLHFIDANVVINGNTLIKDNQTQSGGPAIFMPLGGKGTLSVTGATFEGNKTAGGGGGAVRLAIADTEEIVFKNCTFRNNTNANNGGAICVYRNQNVKVDGCTFDSNTVTSNGGAIYNGGENNSTNTITIINSTFTSNYGYNGGGAIAIHNSGNGKIGTTTNYNYCKSNLTVDGCTFTGNNSVGYGGCIDSRTSGTVNISNSVFTGNYTTSKSGTGSGGALSLKYGQTVAQDANLRGKVNISNCTFKQNHTENGNANSTCRGGAIAMTASSSGESFMDVRVSNCNFLGNYATQGGAIMGHGNATTPGITFYMTNCLLDGNYAYFRNAIGLAFWYMKDVAINNCTMKNCYTTSSQTSSNCPWINIAGFKGTFSNNTFIGQVQLKSNDTSDYTEGGALVRIEPNANKNDTYNFINNLIASPKAWCNAIASTNTTAITVNLYSNKLSSLHANLAAQVDNSDSFNSTNYLGSSDYFGGLNYATDSSAPSYKNTYWAWNGTLATGTPTTMNTLSDVNTKIQTANAEFYTWLQSVGALEKDQRGTARGTTTWPGAYQAN